MRKSKIVGKPVKQHSITERAHLRALKRKSGPSAMRRRERRADLQRAIAIPDASAVFGSDEYIKANKATE